MDTKLKQEQALDIILKSQALPIRGWVMTYTEAALDAISSRKAWPVYAKLPETDSDGVVVGNPEVAFHIPSNEVIFSAEFKFNSDKIIFQGRLYELSEEIIDKQVAHFVDTQGRIAVVFDPKPIHIYKHSTILVDAAQFEAKVNEWALRWNKNRENEDCRLILSQLSAIRRNSLDAVSQAVMTLANTVKQYEPDYWNLLELLISGKITPQECLEQAKGVFRITFDPERLRPPVLPLIQ